MTVSDESIAHTHGESRKVEEVNRVSLPVSTSLKTLSCGEQQ